MTRVTPRTWNIGELITKAMLDEQIKGNMEALWPFTAAGDIAYATSVSALAALAKAAANGALRMNAGATAPAWRDLVASTTSSATPTPAADTVGTYILTALAEAAAFAAPSGTPTDGQKLIIRIKDNGTARALTWNAIYRAVGCTLPSTTRISKSLYIGFVYNSAASKWDCPNSIAEED